MSEKYQVSSSPHVRAKDSTSNVMLYVIIALLPATFFGIWNFGYKALILILVTIAACLLSEWIFDRIVHKKNSLPDLSAVVTGLLLALNLPASISVVGGSHWCSLCNYHRKDDVWGTWTELYESGTWRTLFSADCLCGRHDKLCQQ